jgi:hypothetical protein
MNAWWMWKPKHFPPSKDIEPLLVSMYIRAKIEKQFFSRKTIEYLKEHGPVGCRDKSTVALCEKYGIPAYFSGCLTLTLRRNPKITKKDYILAVDLSDDIVEEVKKRTNRPVVSVSKMILPNSIEARMRAANIMLNLYQSAHCVFSRNLHSVAPAMALETPCLYLETRKNNMEIRDRMNGIKDLVHNVGEEEFLKNKNIYDFDNPPKNPDKYLELREKLIETCTEFTGFNNEKSLIDENIDPVEIMKMLDFNKAKANKLVWFVKNKELFNAWCRMIFLRRSRHDLPV